jgi:hypothetical protein
MIAGAVSSLKTASEIAKGLLTIRDGAVIQSKVIELQETILSAQSSALAAQSDLFDLLNRPRNLERELSEKEAWENEKKRYALRDYGGGTFAYAIKDEARGGEPDHRLCPTCFNKAQKSVLQFDFRTSAGQDKYVCTTCKSEFNLGIRREPNYSRPNREWP